MTSKDSSANKAPDTPSPPSKQQHHHLQEPIFYHLGDASKEQWLKMVHHSSDDERRSEIMRPISELKKEDVLRQTTLTWSQHLLVILLLAFGVPNGIFMAPPVVTLIGYFIVGNVAKTWLYFVVFWLIPLAILPQPFVPKRLESYPARSLMAYFSATFIAEEYFSAIDRPPRIFVGPPHGVFPYGNVLALIAWPPLFGEASRGLAASSALRVPWFKQLLRGIGIVDASRHVARKHLDNGACLGISTGGVAEVFETNADDECVVLKERIGMIKLAIRTGADLVPSYFFGNTKLLSCWAGEGLPGPGRNWLEKLSRKVGFAMIIIYGRFGLPIPYRVPVLGVFGKAIPTKHLKCEDPPMEMVLKVQEEVLNAMEKLFDKYKPYYGWNDKKLIIK